MVNPMRRPSRFNEYSEDSSKSCPKGGSSPPPSLPAWMRKSLRTGESAALNKTLEVFAQHDGPVPKDDSCRAEDALKQFQALLAAFAIRATDEQLDKALRMVNYDPTCPKSLNQSLDLVAWLLYLEKVSVQSIGELCGAEIDPRATSSSSIGVEKLAQYLAGFELDVASMLPILSDPPRSRLSEEERPALRLHDFQATFGLEDLEDDDDAHNSVRMEYVPSPNHRAQRHLLSRSSLGDVTSDENIDLLIRRKSPGSLSKQRKKGPAHSSKDRDERGMRNANPLAPLTAKEREQQALLLRDILERARRIAEHSKALPYTKGMRKKLQQQSGLGVLDPTRNGNSRLKTTKKPLSQYTVEDEPIPLELIQKPPRLKKSTKHRQNAPSFPMPYADWYAQYYAIRDDMATDDPLFSFVEALPQELSDYDSVIHATGSKPKKPKSPRLPQLHDKDGHQGLTSIPSPCVPVRLDFPRLQSATQRVTHGTLPQPDTAPTSPNTTPHPLDASWPVSTDLNQLLLQVHDANHSLRSSP